MDKKQIKGSLMLLLAAFIWGVAFVAQSVGMEYVGPYTFISVRFLIGSVVLVPVILLRDRMNRKKSGSKEPICPLTGQAKCDGQARKTLLIAGVLCGLALCSAATLQQIGMQYTSVGKAGFITAMYIIFVPIAGILFKRFPGYKVWIAVVLSAVGLYLLCMTEGFRLAIGDVYVFLCALLFTVQIMLVDRYSGQVDPVRLSSLQFLVTGVVAAVPMFALEQPTWQVLFAAAGPILYAGVLSSGVAYTLQVVAQRDTNPTVASLVMSLESVFSVLAGWVLLKEAMSGRELLGCVLMFAAIILSQLPDRAGKFKIL